MFLLSIQCSLRLLALCAQYWQLSFNVELFDQLANPSLCLSLRTPVRTLWTCTMPCTSGHSRTFSTSIRLGLGWRRVTRWLSNESEGEIHPPLTSQLTQTSGLCCSAVQASHPLSPPHYQSAFHWESEYDQSKKQSKSMQVEWNNLNTILKMCHYMCFFIHFQIQCCWHHTEWWEREQF